jgi:DNA replication protein DnaC
VMDDKLTKRFVFLCGTPGNGKTHFLVGLYRAKVAKDLGVIGTDHSLYVQFPSLIIEIMDGFKDTHSTRIGLLHYLSVKYLFIDDISKGERVLEPNKMESQVFRDMLLDRFENQRFLIATSNYSSTELKRMVKGVFGEYVSSRIESSGIYIDFPKKDFRKEDK